MGAGGSSQATGPSPQVGTPTMTIQAPQQNAPANSAVTTSGGGVGGAVGGAAGGGGGAQAYAETAVKDSLPIASEELVERLEEISTQQGSPDAAEDPER